MSSILIVEDNVDACSGLGRILNAAGEAAFCVHSGEAALAFLKDTPVDLVLLDVRLPGMDGIAVLERIRMNARTRQTPVIMLSALSDDYMVELARAKGADDYWRKSELNVLTVKERIRCFMARNPEDRRGQPSV